MGSAIIGMFLAFGLCAGVALRPAPASSRAAAPAKEDTRAQKQPWLHTFAPAREVFVSPDGKGSGRTAADPTGLQAAVARAEAGDLIWLAEGTYRTGALALRKNGTREKPIVLRAALGKRATLIGKIDVFGACNWVWGLEVTDPDAGRPVGNSGTLFAGGKGVHFINNIVHDTWEAGIGGWANGPDHVYYGNIIWKVGQHKEAGQRNYPIYTQSDYDRDGYKYIVQNMFLDQRNVGGPSYSFHAYTERGLLSGFVIRQNIITRGRFVLGGSNQPHHHNTLEGNLFYDIGTADIGYRRPIQLDFKDNYLARTNLKADYFWGVGVGAGAKAFVKPLPSVFTGNTFANPPGVRVSFRTSAYVGETRPDGQVPIDPKDIFDNNTYAGEFRCNFHAGGKRAEVDFAGWQRATEEAGKAFDKNSKVVPPPAEPYVALLPNEYEPGRAHLAVFNWPKAQAVTVDLAPVAAKGATFRILKAMDPFGPPVLAGRWEGPVQLPMAGEEFGAFLVLVQPAATK